MPDATEINPAEGEFKATQTAHSITFEKKPVQEQTGQASITTDKMASRRELEMAAGRKRIELAQQEMINRPPRVKSEAEIRAEGSNTPIFRPNSALADRITRHNGMPVSQQVGALMRKVSGKGAEAKGE